MKPFTYQGRLVHSKYNPEREAQRQLLGSFTKKQLQEAKLLILINPGLDFLTGEAQKFQPNLTTLGLYLPDWGFESGTVDNSQVFLFSDPDALLHWLDSTMEHLLLLNPLFFIHPIFKTYQPDVSNKIEKSLTQLVKKHQKQLLTLGYFSRRIPINFFTNRNEWKRITDQKQLWNQEKERIIQKKVVLAASGPSLAPCSTFFVQFRTHIYLAILPSSISFFVSIGVEPDLIVTTDPGYWAGELLKSIPASWNTPIATPLIGNLIPVVRKTNPRFLFFHQQSPAENSCPREITRSIPQIQEYATVAASALDLLITVSNQDILLAGMDLAIQNFQHHVHPHGFDPWLTLQTSRLTPFETKYLQRSLTDFIPLTANKTGIVGLSPSLEQYRNWFVQNSSRWKTRVYQAKTNLPELGFEYIDPIEFIKKNRNSMIQSDLNHSKPVLLESHIHSIINEISVSNISWIFTLDENRSQAFRFLLQTAYFLFKKALSCTNENELKLVQRDLFEHTRRWFNQLPTPEEL